MMHENRGFGAGVCSSSHNIGSSLVYPNKNGCKYNKSCKWKYNTLKANQSASHHELYGTWYVAKVILTDSLTKSTRKSKALRYAVGKMKDMPSAK
jgi:hypothetical protein